MRYIVQSRDKKLVNTDSQRRCYNGAYFSSELVASKWMTLDYCATEENAAKKVEYWVSLNDYAVSQRGLSARSEFRVVEAV